MLFLSIFFCSELNAAPVIKTINITTAGTLSGLITSSEKSSITSLTVTGSIDARDFKFIRDGLTALTSLNISDVNIAAYTGPDGSASTASTVYEVNKIPGKAFDGLKKITEVLLPGNILGINDYAFRECRNLKTIIIPNTVGKIGNSVFYNCINLTTATLSSELKTIGNSVFQNCNQLSTVTIPNNVTSIGENAFYSCAISQITMPETVTSLGNAVFGRCFNLESVTMLSKVTAISEYLFTECTALKSFKIPESVTIINRGAFSGCTSLTSVDIPQNLVEIGYLAFAACSTLVSINIPASVQTIDLTSFNQCSANFIVNENNPKYSSENGLLYNKNKTVLYKCPTSKSGNLQIVISTETISAGAFASCSFLTNIILPQSLKVIDSQVFQLCDSLKTINLPSGLTRLGTLAFQGCRNISTVYSYSNIPLDLSKEIRVFSDIEKSTCVLFVPSGSKSLYQAAVQWNEFTNIVEMTTGTNQPGINDKVLIFPNPAVNEIKINKAIDDLSISNLAGKVIFKLHVNTNNNISIEHLPKGAYLVTIKLHTGEFVVNKLIKN